MVADIGIVEVSRPLALVVHDLADKKFQRLAALPRWIQMRKKCRTDVEQPYSRHSSSFSYCLVIKNFTSSRQ